MLVSAENRIVNLGIFIVKLCIFCTIFFSRYVDFGNFCSEYTHRVFFCAGYVCLFTSCERFVVDIHIVNLSIFIVNSCIFCTILRKSRYRAQSRNQKIEIPGAIQK